MYILFRAVHIYGKGKAEKLTGTINRPMPLMEIIFTAN